MLKHRFVTTTSDVRRHAAVTLRCALILAVATTVVATAFSGCGGGSKGASAGGALTAAQRLAAIDAVNAMFQPMPHTDPATEVQQIAAFIAKRPEFEASGVSNNGAAWGRFTDGRLFIVADNRMIAPAGKSLPIPRSTRKTRAAGTSLPEPINVHLYDAMGTAFSHTAVNFVPTLALHGYQIAGGTVAKGTIEDLKSVQGDGIFYMDAHGGSVNTRSGDTVFSVWSGTRVSPDGEATYSQDLAANKLVYVSAVADWVSSDHLQTTVETHYGITPQFVTDNMHFGSNSLVYFDACSTDDATFKAACIAAGAGVYLGWNWPVQDNAASDADSFLFDRLLGDNAVAPTNSPGKPPLDWAEVQAEMAATTNPNTRLQFSESPSVPGYFHAFLNFTAGKGDAGVLLPSIRSAKADSTKSEVTLNGVFGPTLGTAEVYGAGTALQVKSWTATKIVIGATQDVTKVLLRVNGRPSNPVSISWITIDVRVSPAKSSLAKTESVTLTATVDPKAKITDPLKYHWTTSGKTGSFVGATGTTDAITDAPTIQFQRTSDAEGSDGVDCEVLSQASSPPKSLGSGSATVLAENTKSIILGSVLYLDKSADGHCDGCGFVLPKLPAGTNATYNITFYDGLYGQWENLAGVLPDGQLQDRGSYYIHGWTGGCSSVTIDAATYASDENYFRGRIQFADVEVIITK